MRKKQKLTIRIRCGSVQTQNNIALREESSLQGSVHIGGRIMQMARPEGG